MKLIRTISIHGVYLLINAFVFLLGYIFILRSHNIDTKLPQYAILISIGTSLIASGVIAFLDLWKGILKDKLFEKVNTVIIDGGIENIYEKRDIDKYDVLMSSLTENLDIAGYTLNAFYESYSDILVEKANADAGLLIRILLVDPESEASKHRAELEERTYGVFKNSVERIKNKFANCRNIEIKIINSPLTTMIFRIDDVMFIGPHFYKKASKSTITFELNNKGRVYSKYENEFKRLWNSAKPL